MRFRHAIPAIAILSGLLTGCGAGAERSGAVTEGAAPAGANLSKVDAGDNVFSPKEITAKPGDTIAIEVNNKGNAVHDLTIRALNLSTGPLQAGGIATATITVPDKDVTFVCSIHPGMEGKIRVKGA